MRIIAKTFLCFCENDCKNIHSHIISPFFEMNFMCMILMLMTPTLKRKKARVLPMKEEDMFIAQKTPEFRVIVVGSELFANRFPWENCYPERKISL